ncbi:MAG: hypothetical protein BAJALOKI2v1_300008 [Promethearchaeota archaeon]|nr:MAG: hypothetical protein BAJALOKI2v1_300008 [Candidatus Lokiarchaeota archaeon]
MSEELKNILDSIEKKNQSEAQLEKRVNFLREEIKRLRFTIKEQKIIIQEQKEKLEQEEKIPEDLQILKDLVLTQRKELKEKDEKIEQLNQEHSELKRKQNNLEDFENLDMAVAEARNTIGELTTRNQEYLEKINMLEDKLEKQKEENLENRPRGIQEYEERITQLTNEKTELLDRKNHLQESLNSFKQKLESSKQKSRRFGNLEGQIRDLEEENSRLINQIMSFKKEISYKNDLLEEKSDEISQLQTNIEIIKKCYMKMENQLKSKLISSKSISEKEQEERRIHVANLNEKIDFLEQEKVKLEENLFLLRQQEVNKDPSIKLIIDEDIANDQQVCVLDEMFYLMGNHNKEIIIDFLIDNIDNSEYSKKRAIIKIFKKLRSEKIYKVLLDLLKDENWLVRYDALVALENYRDNEDLEAEIKPLLNDKDVDVREKAAKILSKIE